MKLLIIFFLSFFIFSCQLNDTDILGEWHVDSWIITESNTTINQKMDFMFQEDGRYTVDYGQYVEQGKYWLSGNILFTEEDGKAKKMVKMSKITPDTLSLIMNRSGHEEKVVLVR